LHEFLEFHNWRVESEPPGVILGPQQNGHSLVDGLERLGRVGSNDRNGRDRARVGLRLPHRPDTAECHQRAIAKPDETRRAILAHQFVPAIRRNQATLSPERFRKGPKPIYRYRACEWRDIIRHAGSSSMSEPPPCEDAEACSGLAIRDNRDRLLR